MSIRRFFNWFTRRRTGPIGHNIRWLLVLYDAIIYVIVSLLLLKVYPSSLSKLNFTGVLIQTGVGLACILSMRFLFNIYRQIWRYASAPTYLILLVSDALGSIVYLFLRKLPIYRSITLERALAITSIDLLAALAVRILYQCLYSHASHDTPMWSFIRKWFRVLTRVNVRPEDKKLASMATRVRIAIVGAGQVGVSLASELLGNPTAAYLPICFIDNDSNKTGRELHGLIVYNESVLSRNWLETMHIQEIVFAIPSLSAEKKRELYSRYKVYGCRLKTYDYQVMESADPSKSRRSVREFDIEELLFRRTVEFDKTLVREYYHDKVILITGGGGSIGSELCRQLAELSPRQLVIVDVYENGAYDVQQELRMRYGNQLKLAIEILSVCDTKALDKVFERWKPDIVLHAAAHKHVPLMEHNVIEAVKNNVFGTYNTVRAAQEHGVGRFIMISTDKAVNPTNVMGATKRVDEMIVLNHEGSMHTSATRFGNVLGSAGSVIPLFRRQIMNGGPVTVTDRRIVRYFMTIPEAARLVLQSGAMAGRGELFVLDMGKPVRILELAESMIRLFDLEPYRDIDIVETGLREGEKLYEELLIKSETLRKTDNNLIFIEQDDHLSPDVITEKLDVLREALGTNDDEQVKAALHKVVPTYRTPEEVNANADLAK